MPIEFHLDRNPDFVVAEWTGRIVDADIMNSYRSFYQSPLWQPGSNGLADVSGADLSGLTPEGLWAFIGFIDTQFRDQGVRGAKAAVYCPTDLQFGMARMFSSLSATLPETIRGFRDYDAAVEWLRSPVPAD